MADRAGVRARTAGCRKGRDVGTVIASVKTADGRQKDVPYDVTFAFVVHAFHPEIAILKD